MFIVFNSAVNFIIYIIFNKRFREVLIEMVCKRREPERVVIVAQAVAGADRATSGSVNGTPVSEERLNAEPVQCSHL